MDRGVLPTKAEYWEANCDQIYAAVLEGDFAYFAGDYFDSPNRSYALDKNGAFNLSWTRYEGSTPTSVTVTDRGIIHCVIEPIGEKAVSLSYDDKEYVEYVYTGAEYYICPIGIKFDESQLYYDCFYNRHLAKIRCSGKIGA